MLTKEFIRKEFYYVFNNEFNNRKILDIYHTGVASFTNGASLNEAFVLTKDMNNNLQVFKFFQIGYDIKRVWNVTNEKGEYWSKKNCYSELNAGAAKAMRQKMLMIKINARSQN